MSDPKTETAFQKVPPKWKELFRLVMGPPKIHWEIPARFLPK